MDTQSPSRRRWGKCSPSRGRRCPRYITNSLQSRPVTGLDRSRRKAASLRSMSSYSWSGFSSSMRLGLEELIWSARRERNVLRSNIRRLRSDSVRPAVKHYLRKVCQLLACKRLYEATMVLHSGLGSSGYGIRWARFASNGSATRRFVVHF